ncbi:kinesin-like nuclear fusion protein [Ascosphaera aggregata]|nr:kinesin-like nuclear fusion protein [Ascosphaera aggregata]
MSIHTDENQSTSRSALPRLRSVTSIPRLADITTRANNQRSTTASADMPVKINSSADTLMMPPPPPPGRTSSMKVETSRAGLSRGRSTSQHTGKGSLATNTSPPSTALPYRPSSAAGTTRSGTSMTRIARPASATGHRPKSSNSGISHSQPLSQPQRETRDRPQSSMALRRMSSLSDSRRRKEEQVRGQGRTWPQQQQQQQEKSWDPAEKLINVDSIADRVIEAMRGSNNEKDWMLGVLEEYKKRVQDLEAKQEQLVEGNIALRVELDGVRDKLQSAEEREQESKRDKERLLADAERRAQNEMSQSRREFELRAAEFVNQKDAEVAALRARFQQEVEKEKERFEGETDSIRQQCNAEVQLKVVELASVKGEIERLRHDNDKLRKDLDEKQSWTTTLEKFLETNRQTISTLESSKSALKSRIQFLESGSKAQFESFTRLDQEMRVAIAERDQAKQKLLKEETLRRKLHNQVQELKGNIRVFCRVRPPLEKEPADDIAKIEYPDAELGDREISIQGPEEKTAMGTLTTRTHCFELDRVFGPAASNAVIFEEISQLVQSALDGYNVCIFCYGQTGSGKTYTMGSTDDGMIPRAVRQIFVTKEELADRGWLYEMEGCFVEVYNENIHDLIGSAEALDKTRCEIRHDFARQRTEVVGATVVPLNTPGEVDTILRRADRNRSVGATKANERSSRSHSVFILRMRGYNKVTGEKRKEGVLNLVDLAGSERLNVSGSEGVRLKETQSINRSLACLGDVIAALGEVQAAEGSAESSDQTGHIPYRNSKLTYLLQFSLGGNSKTLMFVNVSPRRQHLGETLTSLKFAVKVSNVRLGRGKRVR